MTKRKSFIKEEDSSMSGFGASDGGVLSQASCGLDSLDGPLALAKRAKIPDWQHGCV